MTTAKRIEQFNKLKLEEETFVIRAIDGDTLQTDVGIIRLLGVNTPEISEKEEGAQEAKDFLNLLKGKIVRQERDEHNTDWGGKRKLRYVFSEGILINAEIIKRGLGVLFMEEGLRLENEMKGG